MSYNRTNIFNNQLLKTENSFIVDNKYRTNPKSHIPGGGYVKVVYKDGTSRIYNKIKNIEAYISYILRYSNDDIAEAFEL